MKLMKGSKAIFLILAVFWVASAYAEDAAECSNSRLSGDYAYTGWGELVGVGPLSSIGKVGFDGNGNITSTLIHGVVNGVQPPADFSTGTGTYTVNKDCTGKMHIAETSGPPIDILIIVARRGHEIRGVNSSPGVNVVSNFIKVDTLH